MEPKAKRPKPFFIGDGPRAIIGRALPLSSIYGPRAIGPFIIYAYEYIYIYVL